MTQLFIPHVRNYSLDIIASKEAGESTLEWLINQAALPDVVSMHTIEADDLDASNMLFWMQYLNKTNNRARRRALAFITSRLNYANIIR